MLFQLINRGDPEVVYVIVYNVAGAQITAGYLAVWDTSTADGVRVTKPATATLSLLVGIAVENIADSAYGKLQAYGYNATTYITNDTSQAIAAGNILVPVNAQWYADYSAASDGKTGFLIAGEAFATDATPAAANMKSFIRCL